jgi:hypothetical protein
VSPRVIRDALQKVWGDGRTVLVTGGSPTGADRVAEMLWRRWGGQVERRTGGWRLHGGVADVCLGFVRDGSGSRVAQLTAHGGVPVFAHNPGHGRGRVEAQQAVTEARDAVDRLYEHRAATQNEARAERRDTAAHDHTGERATGDGDEGRGESW